MFVPFITKSTKSLERRKGGGGKGGGSSGGGGKSSSSGSGSSKGSSSSSSSSKGSSSSSGSKSSSIKYGSGTKKSTSGSTGGGKAAAIPAGQMFAGRIAGGGTRSQIFGSRTYGSGYPNVAGRGVAGRGFPFYFWPLAWPLAIGAGAGIGGAAYLHSTGEYGLPSNSSRPGGSLMTATFSSNSGNTTFRIVSDNSTVASLIEDVNANCTSYIAGNHSTSPSPFPDSSSVDAPKPEQVVQYYRASSIALALEGYNNTATYADEGTLDSTLPNGVDSSLMDCMNQTIGLAAPLLDGANLSFVPSMGTMFLVWLLLRVGSVF